MIIGDDDMPKGIPRFSPQFPTISSGRIESDELQYHIHNCSSPLTNPNQIQFVYNIEKRVDKTGKVFEGLATSYLSKLIENDNVHVKHSKGELVVENWDKPFLLIGLGTGLGGVRGVLKHLQELKKRGQNISKSILFAGVRHESKDFLFKQSKNG